MTPKYVGRDAELLTAGSDAANRVIAPETATTMLLGRVGARFENAGTRPYSDGTCCVARPDSHWTDSQRHWLPNGSCAYSDCGHFESATAECLSPRDFAAQCLAGLVVAEAARQRAEAECAGHRFTLSAANVDALEPADSWGSHFNIAIDAGLWDSLLRTQQRPVQLAFISSAIASAVAWFGAGYVLSQAKGPAIFSLSARAHHLTRTICDSTMIAYGRGLLNTRREPHAEVGDRLHLIGFDYTLASAALQASFMQAVLAAAEVGYCNHLLSDPVLALRQWSWNVDLSTGKPTGQAALVRGGKVTLPVYIRALASDLLRMVEAHQVPPQIAPEARELLPLIIEGTRYAEEGALEKLARHSDWAAQLLMINHLRRVAGKPLDSPEIRLANQDYANTNPQRGTFWRLWEQRLVDPLVQVADVQRFLRDAPAETRAWGRAKLIQQLEKYITGVDWSYVELRSPTSGLRLRIEMSQLDDFSRTKFEPLLTPAVVSVDELAERLRPLVNRYDIGPDRTGADRALSRGVL